MLQYKKNKVEEDRQGLKHTDQNKPVENSSKQAHEILSGKYNLVEI